MPTARAAFKLKSWKEEPYSEGPPKLTRAQVEKSFEGDLVGESRMEYLMVYTSAKEASFVGLEQFTGKFKGREGTFVIQREGTAGADGVVNETFHIVTGSGTRKLKGITGKGKWSSGHADSYPIEFEYTL
jgi:hypothetical protein